MNLDVATLVTQVVGPLLSILLILLAAWRQSVEAKKNDATELAWIRAEYDKLQKALDECRDRLDDSWAHRPRE